jgi:dTDP-4-dehydrorhamnose 3,5-epimerase-like enzyme
LAYDFNELDFEPKRIYFIKDVPQNSERGFHAHKKLRQYILALSGTFDVTTYKKESGWQTKTLSQETESLYVSELTWRELKNFSSNAVCLVIASEHFDPDDYIWTMEELEKCQKEM